MRSHEDIGGGTEGEKSLEDGRVRGGKQREMQKEPTKV